MQRIALGVFVSALALTAPNLAVAQTRQAEVDLSGIDLSSEAGADHALRRIRNAANAVCDVRGGMQPQGERAAARACARDALRQAVEDLDAPYVSARFQRSRSFAETMRRS